jgi:hypothetical protein
VTVNVFVPTVAVSSAAPSTAEPRQLADKLVALGYGKPPTDDAGKDARVDLDVDITQLDPTDRAELRRLLIARTSPENRKLLEDQKKATAAKRFVGAVLPVRPRP